MSIPTTTIRLDPDIKDDLIQLAKETGMRWQTLLKLCVRCGMPVLREGIEDERRAGRSVSTLPAPPPDHAA